MAPRQSQNSAPGVACLACRERHSKCDAALPRCARCVKNRLECTYVASRRGYRGPGRSSIVPGPRGDNSQSRGHSSPGSVYTPATSAAAFTPLAPSYSDTESRGHSATLSFSDDQRHVDLYYSHFHKAHPFLLPHNQLHRRPWPKYLRDAVTLVGSRFCDKRHDYALDSFVTASLDNIEDKTIELVQARLLGAICLHALAKTACASTQLEKAVHLAMEIGLDLEWHAADQEQVDILLAESVRRTWWELFVVDGLFAAFHHRTAFLTNERAANTLLPCDEKSYEDACPPRPTLSYRHLRRRVFMDDRSWSSYALRVEAVGILGRVLSVNDPATNLSPEALQGLDGLLATWLSTLPDTKADPFSVDGQCDELLFQAHMIILMANAYLHLPRSGVFSFKSGTDVACAKANDQATAFLSHRIHAARAMDAARRLVALASLDIEGPRHTPFFTCALVLIAVVHLSAISVQADESPEWQLDRISQVLGLLKLISKAWPMAANVHGQLKNIASAASGLRLENPSCSNSLTAAAAGDFQSLISEMWWSEGHGADWQLPESPPTVDMPSGA